MIIYLHYALLIILLAICTIIDAKTRKIPNWLISPLFLYSIYYLLMHQKTLLGNHWLDATIAFVLALLLTLPGYIKNQFGAGDVKLLMGIALATSTQILLYTIASTAISLVIWSIGQTLFKKHSTKTADNPIDKNNTKLPYAPFVFIGFISALGITKLYL